MPEPTQTVPPTRVHVDEAVSRGLHWVRSVLGEIGDVGRLTGGMTSTMLSVGVPDGEDAVLRMITREPWRTHGEGLATRESEVQRMLTGTAVPAPRTLALDARGEHCGHPAHLMTLLPGGPELDRIDDASLDALAGLLSDVHDVVPDIEVRTYQSWAWEAKYVVPRWSTRPEAWECAFDLLRTAPPSYEPCFLHRDFQPRNVLWTDDRVTGLVDWVEASIGPAWLDVAHCATNLAIRHGTSVPDRFAASYVERTGRAPQPYFDVMDVVGFLPPPGRPAFVAKPPETTRLEERLVVVLDRALST